MAGFRCPFCNQIMSVTNNTRTIQTPSFTSSEGRYSNSFISRSALEIRFYECPHCGEYTIFAKGIGDAVLDINTILRPSSLAKQYPDYIPEQVRNDYEEACAIVSLSPKASATLSRRCLQGIIRDFWGISKSRLVDEITELQNKVPAAQWNVINSLRRLGNIGAHPEADVNTIIDIDPDDAQKLIKVLELLIEQWYVERHNQEMLYNEVLAIDTEKQNERNQ